MSLLAELVSGVKAWVVMQLSDWVVVLVAAVVFFGTGFASSVVFGPGASFGIGIVCALVAASVVGPYLQNRFINS
jgi:hypothetical protein